MKKTNNRIVKLALSRETLRSLQAVELKRIAGGFSDMVNGTSCFPVWCNVDSDPCP